jgi:hypothetical protein
MELAALLRLRDQARAGMTMALDPVEAQALGLLPPGVVARIPSVVRRKYDTL